MSPRSERRPDQWAGAGGRRPSRAGSGDPRRRDAAGGSSDRRPFSRGPAERGPAPRGRTDRPSASRPQGDRGDRPAYARDRSERPSFSRDRGDRPSFSRSQGDRPGGSRRPGLPERRGRRVIPERRPFSAERSTPPAFVAVEPAQGVHADEDQPSDLIWGRHVALAALESGRPLHRIWGTPEMRFSARFLQLLREAKASGVLVEEVTWARLGQITGGAVHQGIVLQAAAADTLDLAALIDGCRNLGESPLLVALDGITDPHNLGAIARSAEAMGAHGLVLPQRRSAGLTGSVAKVAAGALEHLPVARVVNLNRALDSLKQEGYRVVGLAAEGSVSLEQADLDGPLVLVTGSEGDGLSMLTRRHCDQLVSIPLRGATPSLNASVASALLLYEVARRSWMRGLRGGDPAPRLVRPQLPSAAAAPLDPSAADPVAKDLPTNLFPTDGQFTDGGDQDLAVPDDVVVDPMASEQAGLHAAAPEQPAADRLRAASLSPEPVGSEPVGSGPVKAQTAAAHFAAAAPLPEATTAAEGPVVEPAAPEPTDAAEDGVSAAALDLRFGGYSGFNTDVQL